MRFCYKIYSLNISASVGRLAQRHSDEGFQPPAQTRSIKTACLVALLALIGFGAGLPANAQFQKERYTLTADERQELTQGRDHLRQELTALREQKGATDKTLAPMLPDVEIFLDAVDRNLQQDLFFSKQNVAQAKACLTEGESRLTALRDGKMPWLRQAGVVVLGYRSLLDGSCQPYQAYIPAGYDFAAPKPMRLDIFLHGRGGNLNELSFIGGKGWVLGNFGAEPPANIALYPYGRGNNGWRFAGKQDVFEALADCKKRFPVDENQIALRGFSMGGHGAWHIGLQHPGTWAAMSPGAGFVETVRYTKMTRALSDWQEQLLQLYDPIGYAANAKNLPLLPYVGETDTFHAQHLLMYAALKQENAPYQDFLGPNTGHAYEKQTLQSLLAAFVPVRREPESPDVDFVTYTLRWPECKWVHLEGLERHWQRAEVHAKRTSSDRLDMTTQNVSALRLTPKNWKTGGIVVLDGDTLKTPKDEPQTLALLKTGGHWKWGEPKGLRKTPGLCGPIDDALFGPVLAVTGTDKAWNESADAWSGQELARFREGWGMYFRANLPETTDTKLSADDIANHNLYLFGDPGSNTVLRRLLPKLPLKWTQDKIEVAGKTYTASDHLPLLIFPNPENPKRYVVLNTGFSFSRADWNGSNALQYPHLPDYAVIRIDANAFNDDRTKDVELSGFFDESWHPVKR